MNVLMFSLDRGIAKSDSLAAARISQYAERVEKLVVVLPSEDSFATSPITMGKSLLFPVYSRSKSLLFFKLVKTGISIISRKRVFDGSNTIVTSQDPFELGLAAFVVSLIGRLPLHVQLHTDCFSPYYKKEGLRSFIQTGIARFVLKRAARIRVVSERIRKSIIKQYPYMDTIIDVIPIGYTLRERKQVGGVMRRQSFGHRILFVGRLVSVKNVGLAIRAMKKILIVDPQAKLFIVGSGQEAVSLQKLVHSLGLTDNVEFVGQTQSPEVFYKLADVLVLPSNYEGWGMVVIEALSHGVPVVMTDVGCAGEVVTDGVNGRVVAVGDEGAFTEALIDTISDDGLLHTLQSGARKTTFLSAEDSLNMVLESWKKTIKNV